MKELSLKDERLIKASLTLQFSSILIFSSYPLNVPFSSTLSKEVPTDNLLIFPFNFIVIYGHSGDFTQQVPSDNFYF